MAKAAGLGDLLPFQIAWLGSRRANHSQGRGMTQKKGHGRGALWKVPQGSMWKG